MLDNETIWHGAPVRADEREIDETEQKREKRGRGKCSTLRQLDEE